MNLVARAEIVARFAHTGQVDKNLVVYADCHLREVAANAVASAPAELRDEVAMAAWLHDAPEDTPLAVHDLAMLGFPPVVVEAVALLTHTHEHEHDDYVRTIRDAEGRAGRIARIVKDADIKHNALPTRTPPGHEKWVAKRYHRADRILNRKEA